MITHIIYHIPGRKVGCTKSLEGRKSWYSKDTIFEVLEELEDKTDQEAGDIEWAWADKFGYRRGVHYTRVAIFTMSSEEWTKHLHQIGLKGSAALLEKTTPEQRKSWGKRTFELGVGIHALTTEQRREFGKISGKKGGKKGGPIGGRTSKERGAGIFSLTPEEKSEIASRGGTKTSKLGKAGFQQVIECPHCGFKGQLAGLYRWHFDNCPQRVRPPLRRPEN